MQLISAHKIFSLNLPVFDVRSPSEYKHAHIPGAFSLPLFDDEQRATVGKIYKHNGRKHAIKTGVKFFRMQEMISTAEKILKAAGFPEDSEIIVHCWRGGMRSKAVAWLFDLYGFKVNIVEGGYKSFRNLVLNTFKIDYPFIVIGGFTGSNKTGILENLSKINLPVLNIEKIACHKGSAFGAFGQNPQPSQEMFENLLAAELIKFTGKPEIFIEDESQRIGRINIPHSLWQTISNKDVYFLNIPFPERLNFIIQEYGTIQPQRLEEAIIRIQKRLGPLETKQSLSFLREGNITECFTILLKYYDKAYLKALAKKNTAIELNFETVDAQSNSKVIIKTAASVTDNQQQQIEK